MPRGLSRETNLANLSIAASTSGDECLSEKKQNPRTEALANFIELRLQELGLSASKASHAAGLERTAVRDIFRGSVPGTHKLAALAPVLQVKPERLIRLIDAPAIDRTHANPARSHATLDVANPLRFDRPPHDLPLFRQEPGVDGVPTDLPVAQIARPPALQGRNDAYAVYVADHLNAPLLVPGQIAYVDPSRPPQTGRPVRAFFADRPPLVALLVAQDLEHTSLRLLAEAEPRRIPTAEITDLHRVVGFSLIDD